MVIAIDPDVSKSGVAVIDDRSLFLSECLSFGKLLDKLQELKAEQELTGQSPLVVVEAGWLNESTWHNAYYKGARVSSRMGKDIGANQQTGKLIAEMAEHYGLKVKLQKPLVKRWTGHDKKITQPELDNLLDIYHIAHTKKRMNQDCRDAVLIALVNTI